MPFVVIKYLPSKTNRCTISHFKRMALLRQSYEVLPKVKRFVRHLVKTEISICYEEVASGVDSTLAILKC